MGLSFGFFLLLLTIGFLQAQVTIAVLALVKNSDRYDGQIVTVMGTVTGYRERTSRAGNPYTTFRLEDAGASVLVFAWKHQGLRNGQRVQVTGKFLKTKRVGRYTFYNEIEAQRIVAAAQARLSLPGEPFFTDVIFWPPLGLYPSGITPPQEQLPSTGLILRRSGRE